MIKKLFVILFLGTASSVFAQSKRVSDLDILLDRYAQSIGAADSLLAKKFWSQDTEVSFIHPMGNEYGWNGIRNIYAMFANSFSKRRLQYSDEHWTNYNEFAWVTFNWVFDATFPLIIRRSRPKAAKRNSGKGFMVAGSWSTSTIQLCLWQSANEASELHFANN